jgi:hypothetical protein
MGPRARRNRPELLQTFEIDHRNGGNLRIVDFCDFQSPFGGDVRKFRAADADENGFDHGGNSPVVEEWSDCVPSDLPDRPELKASG